jgi:hypothetical protein
VSIFDRQIPHPIARSLEYWDSDDGALARPQFLNPYIRRPDLHPQKSFILVCIIHSLQVRFQVFLNIGIPDLGQSELALELWLADALIPLKADRRDNNRRALGQ